MKRILLFLLILSSPILSTAQALTADIKINGTSYSSIELCMNDEVIIAGNPSGGVAPYATHLWTGGGSQLSPTNTPSTFFTASVLGSVTVVYQVTDAVGTTATDTITININQLPNLFFPFDQVICYGDCIDLECSTTSGDGLIWYKDNVGGTVLGSGPGTSPLSINVCPTATTEYWALSYNIIAGCTKVKRVIVKVNRIIATAEANPNPVCLFDTTQLLVTASGGDAPYTYLWTPNTNISSTTSENPTAWPTATTTYSVLVTDIYGCTEIASVTVNVPLPPSIDKDTTLCFGTCADLTAIGSGVNPITFVWNTLETTTSITVCPVATTVYSVTMTDGNGCTSSATATVTINPIVTANAGPDTEICNGSCTTIGASTVGAGGTAPYTFLWSPSIGLNLATSENPSACPIADITYVVTVTDSYGCTATDDVFVAVNPKPIANAGTDTIICLGQCAIIGGTPTGSGTIAPYDYLWSPSAGLNFSDISNPNACPLVSTTYVVTVTDANGCTNTDNVAVTIRPLPIPSISGPSIVCSETAANIYVTEAGMTDYIWSVSSAGTITAGGGTADNSITISWTGTGSQTVSVSYTDPNGCEPSIPTEYSVVINPLPVPTVSGPMTVCLGSASNLYSTQAGMTNYTWLISSGGVITSGGGTSDNTVTITWNSTGPQTVSVGYTDPNGCTSNPPATFSVNVVPLPIPTITGPIEVCVGTSSNIYTTESGMTNYIWMVSSGGVISSGGGPSDNVVTVDWSMPGSQTVSVSYTDANGCTSSPAIIYNIVVNPLPVPSITGPSTICNQSTGNLYTTQSGMTNYIWTVSSAGTITSGGGTSDNSVTVNWNGAGPQTVSVIYTDANGCTSSPAVVYNITITPLPTPTITGPSFVCVGSVSNTYTTENGMTNYVWTVSSGGTITSGGSATNNTVTVTWNNVGPQSVFVNYTDITGCTSDPGTQYDITVNPLPVPTISGPLNSCSGNTGVIYTTQPGMTNYQWVVSSGGSITSGGGSNDNNVTLTWNGTGSQSVSISYTDPNGCAPLQPVVYTVMVNPLPVPVISGPVTVCNGDMGNIYSTQSGMSNYVWTVSAGGSISSGGSLSDDNVTVNWIAAGTQTVTVSYTDGNGCTSVPVVYSVAVNPLPVPTIIGPDSVCQNSSGNIYITETGMSNYNWIVSAGGSVTSGGGTSDNTVTVSWPLGGAQTISVSYTNSNGCTSSPAVIYNIDFYPLPIPSITGPSSVCAGSSGNIYVTETGMSNYSWSVSGGTISSGGTSTDNTISIDWGNSGTGTVSVNYSDANSCSALIPYVFSVLMNELPVPLITGPSVTCALSSGNLYSTQPGMLNYLWTVSSGGTITAGGTTADNTVTVDWGSAPNQFVSVSYTDLNGCTSIPADYSITINPLPVPAITGPMEVCDQSSGNIYTTLVGMSNYIWSVSSSGNITAGGGTSDNFATVTWNGSGTQNISVSYTDQNGCSAQLPSIYNLTVNPLPVVNVTSNDLDNEFCAGTSVTFTASGGTTYTFYEGIYPNGTIVYGPSGVNTFTSALISDGNSIYVIASNGICADTSNYIVNTVNPLPEVLISTTAPTACALNDGSATAIVTNGTPGYSYLWSTIPSQTNSTATSITAGVYSVIVTDSKMCSAQGIATLSDPGAPLVTLTSSDSNDSICFGECVTFIASGAVDYTFYLNGSTVVQGPGTLSNYTSCALVNNDVITAMGVTSGCTGISNSITTTVIQMPAVYSLTGGGTICSDDSISIGLNGSQSGINYYLYYNGSTTPLAVVPGVNAAVSFGYFSMPGFYTVTAINPAEGCSSSIIDTARIFTNPLPIQYNVTGGGSYCSGEVGLPVGLSNSDIGINYQLWYNNGTTAIADTIISGTGNMLDFGIQSTPGFYWVIATNTVTYCSDSMAGVVQVVENLLPSVFAVNGGGNYCANDDGVLIGLVNSQQGVSYQLMVDSLGTSLYDTLVYGTGNLISFGYQTTPGNYYVIATDTATSCFITMQGIAVVIRNPLPDIFNVSGSGVYCQTTAGQTIGLVNSQVGITYQLERDGVNVGAPLTGTGSAIAFGTFTIPGTYIVTAVNSSTTCADTMSGTVIINPLPTAYNIVGGGHYCLGGIGVPLTLDGSENGVTYQLQVNLSDIGLPVTGNGGVISFGNQVTFGTYTVIATNTSTLCTNSMTGSAIVTIDPLPVQFLVTGGGSACAGSQGVQVGLNGSVVGTNYQLQVNGLNTGVSVNGTGNTISFGSQLVSGAYTVIATVVSSSCIDTMAGFVTVVINPLPSSYIVTGGGSFCAGDIGVPVGISNSETGIDYQLILNGSITGNPLAGNGTALSFGNQTIAGVYQVVAINSATSCTDTMSGSVQVIVNSVTPAFSPVNPEVCLGQILNLCANGGDTYLWNNLQTTSCINVSPASNTTYYVTVSNSLTGCSASDSVLVIVNSVNIGISSSSDTICEGNSVQFIATGGATYLWNTSPPETDAVITVSPVSSSNYCVTVTSAIGCSASACLPIIVNPLPSISLIVEDANSCAGCDGQITVSDDQTVQISSYLWSNGSNGMINTALCPAEYSVTVTSSNGCSTLSSAIVNKGETVTELGIVNTFTPNADGLNDKWEIANLNLYPENELIIVNRWGNEVFSVKDYKNDWDGSSLADGTYFYYLKVNMCEEQVVLKGYISIVR